MNSKPILHVQNLHKSYAENIVALKNINLSIAHSGITAIMGANGSGKSTFLKLIAGKLSVDQGQLSVFGLCPLQQPSKLFKKIGYASQEKALDSDMTGLELLHYFAALYGLPKKHTLIKINQLANQFELTDFFQRRVKTYSGGQQQRLHLAISILHSPTLLLLDEPTSALDPSGKQCIWQFLQTYQQQGNHVMVVSHEPELINRYSSTVILFDNGSIVANDTPDRLIEKFCHPVLHIGLTSQPKQFELLEQNLLELKEIKQITCHKTALQIEFNDENDLDKPKIIQQLLLQMSEYNLLIEECHWQKTNLAAAYFSLTGKKINPVRNNASKQGKKRWKRH